jgi:glyoxylase-like metal-dependent hydrolase (beta-lactamase superfamily II)
VDSNLPSHSVPVVSNDQLIQPETPATQPRIVFQEEPAAGSSIVAFAPNRDTLGGTAYLIVEESNILVDCPAWNETTFQFLQAQGGVRWLFLTHRGAIAHVREIQQAFNCEILIQEQEAYLLPGLTLTRFDREFILTSHSRAFWTPGHSPGSSCLYHNQFGGGLFSGRHLLPHPDRILRPLKTAKTFHWRRQLQSVQRLVEQFTPETLQWICPGANTGFLHGTYAVDRAYQHLLQSSSAL